MRSERCTFRCAEVLCAHQGLLAGSGYGYCSDAPAGAPAAAPSAALDLAQTLDTAVVARRTTIDGAKCRLPVMFRWSPLS